MRIAMRLAAVAASLSGAASAHDPSRATYVGNAGVMVARGETKILFDAFYEDNYGDYASVPAATLDALMENSPPYDGVDAIFVSHVHSDHFEPARMIAFLRARPEVALYAPAQARAAMLAAGVADDDPILGRAVVVDLQPGDAPKSYAAGPLEIDVVSLLHAGDLKDVQNYSWRVTIDDETTVVHFGDAGAVSDNFTLYRDHFAARRPDAAFPPYWWLMEESGRALLEDIVRAKKTIGVHVPKAAAGKGDETRRELGGDVFTDPGETRVLD